MANVEEQLRVLTNLRQAFTTFWSERHNSVYKSLALESELAIYRASHPPMPQNGGGLPGVSQASDLLPPDTLDGTLGASSKAEKRPVAGYLMVNIFEAAELDSCGGIPARRLNPYVVVRCAERYYLFKLTDDLPCMHKLC